MMVQCLVFGTVLSIVLSLELSHVAGTQATEIRGVAPEYRDLYDPLRNFACLSDSSFVITFDKVNDDYCDCPDASDEPGTAACPYGFFYCRNKGHRGFKIPSGRVNDEICDCCDGSDEYDNQTRCNDSCHELGQEARAEAAKIAELHKQGNSIRLDMIEQAKNLHVKLESEVETLKASILEVDLLVKEKEIIKNQIEEQERVVLEKYKPPEPEPVPEADDEKKEAEKTFKTLDTDESGSIGIHEMQKHLIFDRDNNEVVTDEEAMYYLGNQNEVNFDEFFEKAWIYVKPLFTERSDEEKHHKETALEHEDDEETEEHDDEHDPEEDHELEHEEPHGEELEKKSSDLPDAQSDPVVIAANKARSEHQQAEKEATDLRRKIRNLEEQLERDYGPDKEFAPLNGECFKYTDQEYIYSMCMYGQASQSAKSGGSEVLLGRWNEWTGPANNKYSKMKFDGGLACWNGPSRSLVVELRCGKENQISWVGEPNRCEYVMKFETPALCNPDATPAVDHDEL